MIYSNISKSVRPNICLKHLLWEWGEDRAKFCIVIEEVLLCKNDATQKSKYRKVAN